MTGNHSPERCSESGWPWPAPLAGNAPSARARSIAASTMGGVGDGHQARRHGAAVSQRHGSHGPKSTRGIAPRAFLLGPVDRAEAGPERGRGASRIGSLQVQGQPDSRQPSACECFPGSATDGPAPLCGGEPCRGGATSDSRDQRQPVKRRAQAGHRAAHGAARSKDIRPEPPLFHATVGGSPAPARLSAACQPRPHWHQRLRTSMCVR